MVVSWKWELKLIHDPKTLTITVKFLLSPRLPHPQHIDSIQTYIDIWDNPVCVCVLKLICICILYGYEIIFKNMTFEITDMTLLLEILIFSL